MLVESSALFPHLAGRLAGAIENPTLLPDLAGWVAGAIESPSKAGAEQSSFLAPPDLRNLNPLAYHLLRWHLWSCPGEGIEREGPEQCPVVPSYLGTVLPQQWWVPPAILIEDAGFPVGHHGPACRPGDAANFRTQLSDPGHGGRHCEVVQLVLVGIPA